MNDPRYPIGKFNPDPEPTPETRAAHIDHIAALPGLMREAVKGLTAEQLETPYRDGGWTLRQVIHHVPESHMNAFIRFKLALTENCPTIKPYDEAAWARLKDVDLTPINVSLDLLESMHVRWVTLLKSLRPDDFARKLNHPESGVQTLDRVLGLYSWHGRHHLAHITGTKERMKW